MDIRKLPPYAIPVVIIVSSLVIFLLMFVTKPTPKAKSVQEKAWVVETKVVEKGIYRPNLVLYGKVETPRDANLETAVDAYVMKTFVDEGDRVEEGQTLIQLDKRDAQLLLAQREAEVKELQASLKSEAARYAQDKEAMSHEQALLELTKRTVTREEQLKERGIGSEVAIDKASQAYRSQYLKYNERVLAENDHENRLAQINARLAKAEALRDKAALDLERTTIKAPFTGRISGLEVAVGDRVQVGEVLAKLFDTDALELRVQVPSRYLHSVRNALDKGEELLAKAKVNGSVMSLRLDRLSGQVGRGMGGTDALFHIISGGKNLPLGQSVEVLFDLPVEKDTVILPSSAIYGNNQIYVVKQRRMQPINVERVGYISQSDGQQDTVVKSEKLQAGDEVVTTQLPNAAKGLKVDVRKRVTGD